MTPIPAPVEAGLYLIAIIISFGHVIFWGFIFLLAFMLIRAIGRIGPPQ